MHSPENSFYGMYLFFQNSFAYILLKNLIFDFVDIYILDFSND